MIFITADHIKDCKLCLLIFLLYICWMNTQDYKCDAGVSYLNIAGLHICIVHSKVYLTFPFCLVFLCMIMNLNKFLNCCLHSQTKLGVRSFPQNVLGNYFLFRQLRTWTLETSASGETNPCQQWCLGIRILVLSAFVAAAVLFCCHW